VNYGNPESLSAAPTRATSPAIARGFTDLRRRHQHWRSAGLELAEAVANVRVLRARTTLLAEDDRI